MELVYVTRAVRRYWWLTALFVLLSTVAVVLTAPATPSLYETESWVQVRRATSGVTAERDVQNNLVLLASDAVAERVAEEFPGESAASLRSVVQFVTVPGSDVIRIVVNATTPELAQEIANAYIDAYLVTLAEQIQSIQESQLAVMGEEIAAVQAELDQVDAEATAVLAPYTNDSSAAVIPTLEQVDPPLATRRQLLLEEYTGLLASQSELRRAEGSEYPIQTQTAVLPNEPSSSGLSMRVIAAPILGVVLGAIAATVAARVSPRILDADEAVAILERPIAATLPRARSMPDPRRILEEGAPGSVAPTVHELCVQMESLTSSDGALVVVVAGADPVAGVTSLAAEIARRMANERSNVILVDADTSDPELTRALGEGVSGVRRLVRADASPGARQARSGPTGFSPAGLHHIRFAGLGDEPITPRFIDRKDVVSLVRSASQQAPIVIVDVGNLMDAASSVQLAQQADVVVLAVPLRHQSRTGLSVVTRQLAGVRAEVLPVVTPVSRRRSSSISSLPPGVPEIPDREDDGEAADAGAALPARPPAPSNR